MALVFCLLCVCYVSLLNSCVCANPLHLAFRMLIEQSQELRWYKLASWCVCVCLFAYVCAYLFVQKIERAQITNA